MLCKACGSSGPAPGFVAREMMFGLREQFEYETCPGCGTIQIKEIPASLDRYYPKDYYSLTSDEKSPSTELRAGPQPSAARRFLARAILGSPQAVSLSARLKFSYPFVWWAAIARTSVDSAYLDVGCGNGRLLRRMKKSGFTNLAGVDPFAPRDVTEPGLRIRRADISSVEGSFDLVILSHVLEHLPDPVGALAAARRLLAKGGTILARVPVAGSAAAGEYGPDWFNLDPPRHLFVPSIRGMHAVAARAALKVRDIAFDSMEDSFLFSENYRNDIPMVKAPPEARAKKKALRRKAEELNAAGQGDLAAVFLVPDS